MMGKVKWSDAKEYIIGHLRHKLYYNKVSWLRKLLSNHIREQIDFRIKVMDKECYNRGECKICGCATTELQCANKACDKPCYPEMMNKDKWEFFTTYNRHIDEQGFWQYEEEDNILIRYSSFDDYMKHIIPEYISKNQANV